MYTFEFYDKKLHVSDDEDLFLISPVITMGANLSWTVAAQIMENHPYFTDLRILKYGFKVRKKGKLIFRGRLLEFKRAFNNVHALYAEDKLAALNDSICRPHEFQGTPGELFTWFLDNHNSQVSDEQKLLKGSVTVTDPNNYINRRWENAVTTWELMNSRLLDTLGGYFVIRYEEDGDYLDWLEGFELHSNQDIEFGENLVDLERIIDASETYTACIPYGAESKGNNYDEADSQTAEWEIDKYYTLSGETYVLIKNESDFKTAIAAGTAIYEVSSTGDTGERITIESVNDGRDYLINEEMADKYGIIYAPADLVTWGDVTRPENLKIKALDWLNNAGIMLKESVNLSAVDLAMAGVDINSYEMYQNVRLVSEPHNIKTSYLITNMRVAADLSEVTQITVGAEKKTLLAQISDRDKEASAVAEKVEKIESDYATNESVTRTVTQEVVEASSRILQAAEEITLGILSGYTKASELEAYKKEIENLFKANEDGFAFEFSQLEERITAVGREIVERDQFIRLEAGNIIIGKSDSPVQAKFTNDALEFAYNGQTVARFTNEVLEVRNIAVENQVQFGMGWAIRPGQYITGKGYNLDDVWIGG